MNLRMPFTFVCFLPMVALQGWLVGEEPAQPSAEIILACKVRAIVEAKCIQCHGEQVEKPYGDFGYIRDLQRVTNNSEYIVRTSLSDSEFFRLIRDDEMPPSDSDIPPMTSAEKQVVRQWITAGAPYQVPKDWSEIAARNAMPPPPKSSNPQPPDYTSVLPPEVANIEISLESLNMPAAAVFQQIEGQAKIKIQYERSNLDPNLSIRMKKGTVGEALRYLVLNGNLVLTWRENTIRIVSNSNQAK